MNVVMIKRLVGIIMGLLIIYARKSLKDGDVIKYKNLIDISTVLFVVGVIGMIVLKIIQLVDII